MAAITSLRSWNDCSTLEQMQRRYLKMAVSAVFTIGFIVFLTCIFVTSVILLSAFFSRASTLFFRTSNGKPYFVCFKQRRALVNILRITWGIFSWNLFSRADQRRLCTMCRWNRMDQSCFLLLCCLWIYSATRKVVTTVMTDISSGTIAWGYVSIMMWLHCHNCKFEAQSDCSTHNLGSLITDERRWDCYEPLLLCFSFVLHLDCYCSHHGLAFVRHQPADLLNTVQLLSAGTDVSSLTALDRYSRPINLFLYHRLQSLIVRRYFISIKFLIVQSQHSLKVIGTLQLHFADISQDILVR